MKKFIRTSLALVLGLAAFSSIALPVCQTSSANFCTCYVNNFKASCPEYLPAAMCASMNSNTIKNKINSIGVNLSCSQQHDTPKNDCVTTTEYFLKHC